MLILALAVRQGATCDVPESKEARASWGGQEAGVCRLTEYLGACSGGDSRGWRFRVAPSLGGGTRVGEVDSKQVPPHPRSTDAYFSLHPKTHSPIRANVRSFAPDHGSLAFLGALCGASDGFAATIPAALSGVPPLGPSGCPSCLPRTITGALR